MSHKVFNLRILRIQARIKEEGLDAIIVCSPQNVYYLSGFNPIIFSQPNAVIIPLRGRGDAILITHSIRFNHANKEAFLTKIKIFGKWGKYGEGAPQDFFTAVKITLQELSLSRKARIGIEFSSLPYSFFLKFKLNLPNVEFLNIENIIMDERMIKDEVELEFIKDAACIADAGMEVAIDAVCERKSEIEVSVNAMVAMQEIWKEKYPDREVADFGGGVLNALWAGCLSGPRMNLMCDSPSSRTIKEGDLVMIVVVTTINGYHAENERTIAVGSMGLEQEKLYNTVIKAGNEAINEIRPGIPIYRIYNSATRIMTEEGYGNILPGRIGHGLGLYHHEGPSIAPDNRDLLKEGMVITFEPGLRVGKLGGIQNSDTILVNSDGFEYLTHTKRGFLNA